ncbi:phosphate/phosphite/phosphonate ABC transporter substrate-binding protein [Periweissella cryptocerci]|uniref:Phosphate/phosphite/phosphonate ABC transporter substrate-binding protein n=1 Tax=Periweissella cryptocerci TaxID=2506420 RepID=A0A4P6YXD6_9LACO|nr:phosphate/phosphite/phosphonate ABC transporter substrate-binding protein [Periweissella cryptocerci]
MSHMTALAVGILTIAVLAGCSSKSAATKDTITVAFLPSASVKDMTVSRDELKQKLETATGKKIKLLTTTDYNITIEAIASGKAQVAYIGSSAYVQAHAKNKAVVPIATTSGPTGTLSGAQYHSYFMVNKQDAPKYESNGKYSIDDIKGQKISFVSTSSTSGFEVPTNVLAKTFNIKDKTKFSKSGDFFSTVLYGNSHQGSAVNLLNGDADVAVFDDEDMTPYLEVKSGSWDKVGSTFDVKKDAAQPFKQFTNKEVVAIGVNPVQNDPIVVNKQGLTAAMIKKLTTAFTSAEFASNQKLMGTDDSKTPAIFTKPSEQGKLVVTDDNWYKPTHTMMGK